MNAQNDKKKRNKYDTARVNGSYTLVMHSNVDNKRDVINNNNRVWYSYPQTVDKIVDNFMLYTVESCRGNADHIKFSAQRATIIFGYPQCGQFEQWRSTQALNLWICLWISSRETDDLCICGLLVWMKAVDIQFYR